MSASSDILHFADEHAEMHKNGFQVQVRKIRPNCDRGGWFLRTFGVSMRSFCQAFRTIRRGANEFRLVWAIFPCVLVSGCVAAQAQVTFAGSQFALAGGPWSMPEGLAIDGSGNLFIADSGNNRVVELPESGAGFGAPLTILSGLSSPTGLAVDWKGSVYLSDTGNNRVLMLPKTIGGFGEPVTIATGFNKPAGLAVDLTDNVYVADAGNNCVKAILLASGAYAPPIVVATGLKNPLGVAVDATGNLYVADTGNSRVMKQPWTANGYGPQQYLFGNQFDPVSISVDKHFNLYIADSLHRRALEEPWAVGANRFANEIVLGSGFSSPTAVITDPSGNFYVADSSSNQILKVVEGTITLGEAQLGSVGSSVTYNFSIAAGTTLGAATIYTEGMVGGDFADAGASTCLAQAYTSLTVCGINVCFAPAGSGTRLGAVTLPDKDGNPLATAFLSGVGDEPQIAFIPGAVTYLGTELSAPAGVAVDGGGNVYIADTGNNRVVKLPWTGSGYGAQVAIPLSGVFSPMGVAVDGAGNLYVVSNGNDKTVRLPWIGSGYGVQTKVGTGLYGPSDVAVDVDGGVYVTDTLNSEVLKIPWTGSSFAQEQELGNYHRTPIGIAVNGAGTVFFSDPYQNTISYVEWTGSSYLTETTFRNLDLNLPTSIAVDGNSNLYILDTGNNRVVMLPWNGAKFGNQVTVATGFNAPAGMSIDSNGNIYVADTGNNQIVKINQSIPAAMNFANTYLGSTSADSPRVTLAENIGNEILTISGVSYPGDFPQEGGAVNPCEADTSLGPSETCELAVDFTPQSPGSPLSEALSVTDNSHDALGSQQLLIVSGTSLPKSAQSIQFSSIPAVIYGAAPIPLMASASSGLPVTFEVVSGPGALTRGGQVLNVIGAGTVVVEAKQSGNLAYAAAPPVAISLIVTPATLTVTPSNTAAVYGSIPTSFRYSITGYVNGDNPGAAAPGHPAITSSSIPKSGVGTYVLAASIGTLSSVNYIFAFATATLTVTRGTLQVSALPQSRNYGSPMQSLTWRLNGFVNGDTASVVTGSAVLTSSANSGSPVGSYPILVLPGTLAAANYTFTTVDGVLTVLPAVLRVVAANATISYGSEIPALEYSISGLVNGDTQSSVIHGAPVIATSAANPAAVGTYAISLSLGTLAAVNYSFQLVAGVLSVEKAALTVTPQNAAMVYGGVLPSFFYTVTGFVNGDSAVTSVSGVPAIFTNGSSRSLPGNYIISASVGSLESTNYTFAFVSGMLSVGKALLTVTPSALSMTYGGHLPTLAYRITGFVNGDGGGVVHGAPQLLTQATPTSPVGVYPIVGSVGTLSSLQYNFQVLNGTLAVIKAVLTVLPKSQNMIYGSVLPSLSYALTGFVNGDTQQSSTTGSPSIATLATAHSPVGSYSIASSAGSLTAGNYSFQFDNGTLAISKAPLRVTANNLSMVAGTTVPALTFSTTGFANGDTFTSATTGAPALSTNATATSKAGTYVIAVAQGSLESSNYAFSFANGVLTVTQASISTKKPLKPIGRQAP